MGGNETKSEEKNAVAKDATSGTQAATNLAATEPSEWANQESQRPTGDIALLVSREKPKSRKSLFGRVFSRLFDSNNAQTNELFESNNPGEDSRLSRLHAQANKPSWLGGRRVDRSSQLPTRRSGTVTTKLTVVAKKGGVGKSTLSMALAGFFATSMKQRVLVVDLDSQATASINCLGKEVADSLPADRTIAALFRDDCEPEPEHIVHESHLENIWCIPANEQHFAEHLDPRPLQADHDKQLAVRDFLGEVSEYFDWVILDSPPALQNLAGWNCMTTADFVISPVQMEGYSAQKVVGVEEAVSQALSFGNPHLRFLGYIVSEFDNNRKADHGPAEEALRAKYGRQVFDTVIYRRAKFPQSQGQNEHIFSYAPKSEEAKLVESLAKEVLKRVDETKARRAAA